MYKFRVYIYLIHVPFCACQNSYGFKNLDKLEGGRTNFKIPLGTCVFKKSCSTSRSLTGNRCFFPKKYAQKTSNKNKKKCRFLAKSEASKQIKARKQSKSS